MKSFIAVDLKVIEVKAPAVARALGMELPTVLGALSLLWHHCWSMKSGTVSQLELRGYFQHPEAGAVLSAFGLLESTDEGWRVRGAERYLRVSKQRSEAGRSRASSTGRSAGKFTSGAPADHQRTTSGQPALTPSTEHRTPNTEKTAPAAPAPRETDALCEDFTSVTGVAYRWQGAKDGKAFADLRKTASLEEIRARWRFGLTQPPDEWRSCRTVAQLAQKWNDLVPAKAEFVSVEHRPSRLLL